MIAKVYRVARVPEERLRNLPAALGDHVGDLLRERLGEDDVAAAGLKAASPKKRIMARQRENNAQAAAY